MEGADKITLGKKILRAALKDVKPENSQITLYYVSDQQPGFTRLKKRNNFVYFDGEEVLKDQDHLERIRKLVIPPAWKNVWICKLPNGHLQATGFDQRHRKQYRYHAIWNVVRNHTKFFKMAEFGRQLPQIRSQLEKDLSLPGFPQQKVLALVVRLMERTSIRVGNAFYEKLYGSFGLTTLKDQHVSINGTQMHFSFRGKKGVKQEVNLRSKKLAKIVQGCKDIPGKELFAYYDESGKINSIDSGMVNNYIKTISGGDFTAKDFRTWAGTVQALLAFKELGDFNSESEMNRKIVAAINLVAQQLGNTRAVCKKYYVHPLLIELYKEKQLHLFLNQLDAFEPERGFNPEEQILLQILEKKL